MEYVFGKPAKTPAEVAKESVRSIRSASRSLERERLALENTAKKRLYEARQLARKGDVAGAKATAKAVARSRAVAQRLRTTGFTLEEQASKVEQAKSTHAVAEALRSAAKAMRGMNNQYDVRKIHQLLRTFARESEIMEHKQEEMDDQLDDVSADDDKVAQDILDQVMAEIGIELEAKMPAAMGAVGPVSAANPAKLSPEDEALSEKVKNLGAPR